MTICAHMHMDRTKLSGFFGVFCLFFNSPWTNKARQYFEFIHQFSVTVLTDLEVSVAMYIPMASAEIQGSSREQSPHQCLDHQRVTLTDGFEVMQEYCLGWIGLEKGVVVITFRVVWACCFLESYRCCHLMVPSCSRDQGLDKSLKDTVLIPVAYFRFTGLWFPRYLFLYTCCCHCWVFCHWCKLRVHHMFYRHFWAQCLWYSQPLVLPWPPCLAFIRPKAELHIIINW